MTAAEIRLTDEDFERLSRVVERQLGIRMPNEKRALVEQRLRKPIARSGEVDFRSWAARHLDHLDHSVLSDLADALTTNHTHFWREPEHFEHLRDHALPERLAAHQQDRDLRVWCAAAATGEEPYQLAMMVHDVLPPGWRGGLLATDVSARALTVAKAGVYPADRLAAMPEAWRRRYVEPGAGTGTIRSEIKNEVTFRRLNLLSEWRFRTPFDVIFCRNVLIYFDPPVRNRVITQLVSWLQPGGWLYVGHAEALARGSWPIAPAGPGIWRVRGGS